MQIVYSLVPIGPLKTRILKNFETGVFFSALFSLSLLKLEGYVNLRVEDL